MSDGIRTRDRRDHNPELYQLSYAHREGSKASSAQPALGALRAALAQLPEMTFGPR